MGDEIFSQKLPATVGHWGRFDSTDQTIMLAQLNRPVAENATVFRNHHWPWIGPDDRVKSFEPVGERVDHFCGGIYIACTAQAIYHGLCPR